jgi:integrase
VSKKRKSRTGNADWKGELQRLLRAHNAHHAMRGKLLSFKSQDARGHGLFRIFALLRRAGYKVGPSSLGGRHVEFLMQYWTPDKQIEEGLRTRGSKLAPLSAPFSAAYIQQQLSFLRALCEWVGKPGLVLPAHRYVSDPALVSRATNATRDRTWSGSGVDREAVVACVTKADPVVGLQLEVMIAFGLRRKEAVMFSPALAEVPTHALPVDFPAGDFLAFLRIKRGTKGGRVRFTAIRTDEQRQVFVRALAVAPRPGTHIGRPGQSLKQALTRFSNVLRRCGVSQRELGVTPHGLRHEFAADLFYELAEVPAPIKGGQCGIDHNALRAAYLEVARQMGHGRARITGAYLGARQTKPKTHDASV